MADGSHSIADFAATSCDYADPVSGDYRGVDLWSTRTDRAPPVLLARILSRFDVAAMDPWGAERAPLEIEATNLAYDARNRFVADPDHVTRMDHMTAVGTAARLAALIDPKRAMENPRTLAQEVHRDTIYITVVDHDRMAVSLIYSILHGFGSGIASPGFGILFHDCGAGFTLEEGHANEACPGKRPMHTIIPAMLRQGGRVVLPFGVMGGSYQATGHARLVSNIVDFGLDPQAAIDAPRCFWDAGAVRMERDYSEAVRAELAERGTRGDRIRHADWRRPGDPHRRGERRSRRRVRPANALSATRDQPSAGPSGGASHARRSAAGVVPSGGRRRSGSMALGSSVPCPEAGCERARGAFPGGIATGQSALVGDAA